MGCGCCNKNKKNIPPPPPLPPRPLRPAVRSLPIQPSPPPPKPRQIIKAPVIKVINVAPPGSYNPPGKFCEKCGWIVAVSKYADPRTGQIIEKRSCTNRRCSDY